MTSFSFNPWPRSKAGMKAKKKFTEKTMTDNVTSQAVEDMLPECCGPTNDWVFSVEGHIMKAVLKKYKKMEEALEEAQHPCSGCEDGYDCSKISKEALGYDPLFR